LSDINETLWGGFVIRSKTKIIYFAGDSGYGNHFAQIGQLFPTIDLAMIGAGAYSPRWFMSPNHQDPQHAIQAFVETKAKTLIPFHYGTFDSGDEPPSEPELLLTQSAQTLKILDKIKLMTLGSEYDFSNS
jgi:L-ascorbate metabolism protein UlaG (beta-lactamase superfamily)